MLNRLILLVTLGTGFTYCQAQQKTDTTLNKKAMEHFDIKTFEKNKIGIEYDFTLDDGTKIRHIDVGNGFVEEKTGKNSPFTYQKQFDKNGILKLEVASFYTFETGVVKEYNTQGSLIRETDNEKPYKLSVYDIGKIMLDTFKVDIIHPKDIYKIRVARDDTKGQPFPYYQVWAWIEPDLCLFVLINAGTGKIEMTNKQTQKQINEEWDKEKERMRNEYKKKADEEHKKAQKPKGGWSSLFE